MFNRLIVSTAIALLSGCASYHAPGRGADLSVMGVSAEAQKAGTPTDINASFDKRPLANFPANIAVVRIQAPGYRSATAEGFGSGAYSIVLTRDVEPEDAIGRIAKLPMAGCCSPASSTPTKNFASPLPNFRPTCCSFTRSTPPSMTAISPPRSASLRSAYRRRSPPPSSPPRRRSCSTPATVTSTASAKPPPARMASPPPGTPPAPSTATASTPKPKPSANLWVKWNRCGRAWCRTMRRS